MMNKTVAYRFMIALIITILLLGLRLAYLKSKYSQEIKSIGKQNIQQNIKCLYIGYSGFPVNKIKNVINKEISKFDSAFDVIFIYFFNLASSHKEIVLVSKEQQLNIFYSPFGPPELSSCEAKKTRDNIKRGFYILEEQNRIIERVVIKYWGGDPEKLATEYVKGTLGFPHEIIKEEYCAPSWIHQRIASQSLNPLIVFWEEKADRELKTLFPLRLAQFMYPILLELLFLLYLLIQHLRRNRGDLPFWKKLKVFIHFQSLAFLYYPISVALFAGFIESIWGWPRPLLNHPHYLSYFIYLSSFLCFIYMLIIISKYFYRESHDEKSIRINLVVLLIILITPIVMYF